MLRLAAVPLLTRRFAAQRVVLGLLALTGCRKAGAPAPTPPPVHVLPATEVVRLLPTHLADAEGWATDLVAAFAAAGIPGDLERVCGAVAVLEQESGFQADPPVPGLADMVRKRLDELAASLGPPGRSAVQTLLAERKPGDRRTFAQRLRTLRTERDLDLLFRDMLGAAHADHPVAYRTANLLDGLFRRSSLEDLNPVGTVGSMQVGVSWVLAHSHGQYRDADAVRDMLFTREGGLRWGVQRLWGYPARYPRTLFRFADYNAGEYASRNAAVQHALTRLTGLPLAADGDLLAYDRHGEPRADESASLHALLAFAERSPEARLTPAEVRRDVRLEKQADFESSPTYRALQRVYRARYGKPLPAAELPELELTSPKLHGRYSTARYARAVDAHHRACLAQGQAPAEPPPEIPRRDELERMFPSPPAATSTDAEEEVARPDPRDAVEVSPEVPPEPEAPVPEDGG